MLRYPLGVQTFAQVRENGCVYVDKTALIYQLIKTGKVYFLSRPRRFGKSLLVSTLKSYFEGSKELFEGLAIEKLEAEWLAYPVFHIDFNGVNFETTGAWKRDWKIMWLNGKSNTGRARRPRFWATGSPTCWNRLIIGTSFSSRTGTISDWKTLG